MIIKTVTTDEYFRQYAIRMTNTVSDLTNYVELLEEKVRSLSSTVSFLEDRILDLERK